MSTRMSNGPSITRDGGDVRTSSSLTFEFGTALSLWIDDDLDGLAFACIAEHGGGVLFAEPFFRVGFFIRSFRPNSASIVGEYRSCQGRGFAQQNLQSCLVFRLWPIAKHENFREKLVSYGSDTYHDTKHTVGEDGKNHGGRHRPGTDLIVNQRG